MFTPPTNIFENVLCPSYKSCCLPHCVFKHSNDKAARTADISGDTEPTAKRRRLNATSSSAPATKTPSTTHTAPARQIASSRGTQSAPKSLRATEPHVPSATKPAVPLQTSLRPLSLKANPAGYAQRPLYLSKLHESMQSLNEQVKSSTEGEIAKHTLDPSQLVDMAVKQEAKMATDSPVVYPNVIKAQLLAYKRMSIAEWTKLVVEACDPLAQTAQAEDKKQRPFEEELTDTIKRSVLRHMINKQEGLEQFGYVVDVPTAEMIEQAAALEAANNGYEECTRCQTRFQVFPDRREDGALTSGGDCNYHWGRPLYRKGAEPFYRCCNGGIGKVGCTTSPSHVFELKDASRQARLLQFACTPPNDKVDDDFAVALDCEMGFTTTGNELIRLTVLHWPNGKVLLDFLVRPIGAILDFNTRFSGVSAEDFANAKPFDVLDTNQTPQLQIVDSPQKARECLFDVVKPSTVLIGHAIENDLRALRIVHPTIVDTALLCPHPRAKLPIRRALRDLAKQYLDRTIQTGGADGHDSHEDAKATGDIVEALVVNRYGALRRQCWKAVDNELVAPVKQEAS